MLCHKIELSSKNCQDKVHRFLANGEGIKYVQDLQIGMYLLLRLSPIVYLIQLYLSTLLLPCILMAFGFFDEQKMQMRIINFQFFINFTSNIGLIKNSVLYILEKLKIDSLFTIIVFYFKNSWNMTGMNKSSPPTFQDSLIKNSVIGIPEKLI